jgi:hypothetical protein
LELWIINKKGKIMGINFNKVGKVVIKFSLVCFIFILGIKPMSYTGAQTAEDGKASRIKKVFSVQYSVAINIKASPNKIWAILTNAREFPSWNSTIDSIKGNIAPGEKLTIYVKISPGRAFSPRVSEFLPEKKMVWSDGTTGIFKGVRTYTLTPKDDGSTEFAMSEIFSGAMFPMIAGSLPDFRSTFEQYASDLKRKAESQME